MHKRENRPPSEPAPITINIPADHSSGPAGSASTLDAWHRSQFVHDLRTRRRNAKELDALCGVERLVPAAEGSDSYRDSGLLLGMPERVAAGRQLKVAA